MAEHKNSAGSKGSDSEVNLSEETFKSVLEYSPDAIALLHKTRRILYANSSYSELTGYSQEELSVCFSLETVHPDDRSKIPPLLIDIFETPGALFTVEYRLRTKNGNWIWLETNAINLLSNPKVKAVVFRSRDITDRKRKEQNFDRMKTILLESQKIAHFGSFEYIAATEKTVWSDEEFRIYGVDSAKGSPAYKEMLKNNIHLDDSELLDAVFQKAKETGGIYELEHKIIRPDGTVRVVHDLAHPYFDDDGNLYKYIGTTLDITERKKTEERLATQYAVARVLAGSVTLANAAPRLLQVICENLGWELGELWSIDRGANLLRCAETWHVPSIDANEFIDFCLRTGFAPGVGLPGRVWQSGLPEWIADVTTDANLPRAVMAEKAGLHSAFAFPVMLGSEILGVMAFFVREMRQPDEELLKMLSTIVSQIGQFIERKRAEEALRKAHDELEQRVVERTRKLSEANMKLKELDRLKSLFIASMSHELRTPLNSVIGFSSILVNEWMGPLNEEQKENLSAILRSGKHLLALINDVIDVSKIEAGKIESFVENFDIHELLSEAVTTFTGDIKEKGLDLKVEAIHQPMRADRRRLLQCVLNLVSNAVKFTEKGSVRVAARRVRSSEFKVQSEIKDSELKTENSELDRDFMEIAVADTGIGIQEEDLPKLYRPFVRLVAAPGSSIPGTGLGLYLTRKLVTQVLKGDIICMSRYGEGSAFTIRIPL